MADNGTPYFIEWREEIVSKEWGNRVVHYYLKDVEGESVLAVVGTERSVRHMFYVVSDQFLSAYGAENSVYAGYKWRARREVVNWLTSMLSKQHQLGNNSRMLLLVLWLCYICSNLCLSCFLPKIKLYYIMYNVGIVSYIRCIYIL